MSDLTKPSPNISALATLYPEGDFPSHIDVFGKGGFVVLNDDIGSDTPDDFINERVTHQRRKEGMLVYVSSNSSYYRCVVTGSSESEGEWTKQYFAGRYFHGATAPTATDIQLGEKWFDTVVGTEYTYIPIADGSTHLAWVDIDHLGQSQGEVGTDFVKTSGDTMNGTLTGTNASFTGITATNGFIGTLTADRAFRISNDSFLDNELVTKDYVDNLSPSGNFVLKTGDEMSGTLTGTTASFSNSITAPSGFIGTLTADRAFRQSEVPFVDNEFITKNYNDNIDENLITNGNFLVWQRGKAFRALSDLRVRNQTKKQIGLLYYNTEHNTNLNLPSQYIGGRTRFYTTSGYYNYGRMSFHAADRWNFGWQNYGTADSFSPLTGQGFYVYRGFINPEDAAIVENSSYFSRISTSPPPSNSPNRSNDIVNINNSGYEFLRNTVNPTSPNGLTYGAIVSHLLGDDRPNELKGASADPSRVTDVEYVTSYFDPYNVCIPITGNTDVAGQRAALRNNSYWASIRHVIPQKYFKKMKFGTPQAEDLTLRFYARSNVVGDYYVCFQSGWPTVIGEDKPVAKVAYKKYTIDTANTWNLIEIGLSGDTSNVGSSEGFLGPWYNSYKNDANIGLSIWWLMGAGSAYLETQGNDDNYNWRFLGAGGGKWGGNSQVNLLGATGNYFDIAEVSLVKSSHQGKIHFPRKESEILEECYQYYRHISFATSESTQAAAESLGTCPGTQVVLRDSTNEYGIELDHPIRMPQDNATTMSSIMFSNTKTNNNYSVRLTETGYTRIYPKINTRYNNGTFPASGPSGPVNSGTGSDLNRLAVGWSHDIGPTLDDILLGMTGHTNSPFRDGTFYGIPNYYLKTYGWDSATDLSDYFKLSYGHRGWCSPTVYGRSIWYVSNGYSENPSFYVGWTRRSTSQPDSALFGSFSFDTEYLWNERD